MISTEKFIIEEALGFGWRTMTGKFGTLFKYIMLPCIVLVIIQGAMHFALGLDKNPVPTDPGTIGKIAGASIIQYLLQMFLVLGMFKVGLKIVNDEQPEFSDYLNPLGYYWFYFLGSIVFFLILVGGTILLVIPAIIWYIQFHYYIIAIVDKSVGPIQALKISSHLTKGTKWKLFLFGLICTVITVAGFLCLIVGAIPASLVTFMASIHVYKQLSARADQEASGQIVSPA